MDDLFVAIPWRSRGDGYREKSLRHVKILLRSITNIDPVFVDGNRNQFSLPEARNVAVRMAKDANKNIVLICDADTIVESHAIYEAIEIARKNKHVVLPYTLCKPLTLRSTNLYYEGHDPSGLKSINTFDWSVGGVYVTSVSAWDHLAGQDERFTNWGCEDTAFSIVAEKMGRPLQRIHGTIYPLWHESYAKETDEWYIYNSNLLKEYAQMKTWKLRREISERRRGSC